MSESLGEAVLTLAADATGLDKDIAKAGGQALGALGKIGQAMKTAIPIALVAGGAVAVGKALVDCVKMSAEEQKGIVKLQQAVKNSGVAWEDAEGSIEGYLRTQLKRIGLDDGDGRESIADLTAATGDYQRALELLPYALDLSAAKGMDLATATKLVGRVAMGQTSALSRYGITLEKGATAADALAAMNAKFGGQAEAQANTLEGQQKRVKATIDEIKETIGGPLLGVLADLSGAVADVLVDQLLPAIEEVAGKIGPMFQAMGPGFKDLQRGIELLLQGETSDFMELLANGLITIAEALGITREQYMPFIDTLYEAGIAFFDLAEQYAPLVQQALGELENTLMFLWINLKGLWRNLWGELVGTFQEIWPSVQQAIGAAITTILALFTALQPSLREAMMFARQVISEVAAFVIPLVGQMVQFIAEKIGYICAWIQENLPLIRDTVEIVLTRIQQIWNAVWPTLSQVLLAVWNTIKDGISTSLEVILGIIKAVMQIITGDWEGAWETIKATANTLWEGIKKIILDAINTILAWFGVKTSWGQLKDAITKPFKDAWTFISGILDKIKAGIDTVVNWWNNLTSTAPGKPVAGTGGQYKVPGAAEGANFVAYGEQLLRVGEREPEYVSVTPLSKLPPGGPGGQSYNLNIYTSAPWEPIVADFQMLAAMGA